MGATFKGDVQYWLRNQQWWLDFRSSQREGWPLVFRRLWLWPRILMTRPVVTEPVRAGADVEIHLICWRRDWLSAVWALKSLYHHSGVSFPLVIHLQSRIAPSAMASLREHFPNAKLITLEEADHMVPAHLAEKGLARCLASRMATSFMYKLLDFQVLSSGMHVLGLDADILFFRKPHELLRDFAKPMEDQVFQEDVQDCYNGLTLEQARAELGIELKPGINTGITLRRRDGIDLRRVEELLANPNVSRPSGHTEQAIHALIASEQGKVTWLPRTYGMSLSSPMNCDELVCRHYCGPSRRWLTLEGMPYLLRKGFLKELGG